MKYQVHYVDGRHEHYEDCMPGTFGALLRSRRERKQREADEAREERLVQLQRSINELEQWHHDWRLRHDEDYRALHPGEWCDGCRAPSRTCGVWCLELRSDRRARRMMRTMPRTGPELSVAERRRATRNVVNWVREQMGESE
ncbi:hypothetical protein AQJ23_45195 [Streptomyces antibioticus]|nr:hypothetical protein [Streptomyces antibioticus]KUN16475.1 hypothetical protein AQJ23_45195 [Streptomyces antibioticus]